MKTLCTLTLLVGSTLLSGGEPAQAQRCRTRPVRRVVIRPPAPIVTQPVANNGAAYGSFSHVDELAIEMEQLSREILWEMHFNYSHNRGYRQTYAEAYEILTQAKSVHREAHHGHRAEIARAVQGLDRLFHHVEDDIRSWRPSHGHFAGHGGLFDTMEAMERTLHHLMQDVGVTSSATEPPAPGLGNPPLPAGNPPRPSLTSLPQR